MVRASNGAVDIEIVDDVSAIVKYIVSSADIARKVNEVEHEERWT